MKRAKRTTKAKPAPIEGTKPSNPKAAIGAKKLPLELVPDTLEIYAALGFFEGASKYGRYNWRVAGVRASTYVAALRRHVSKWWNGEEIDPDTGVPHLANAICCLAILVDSLEMGSLTDDRPPSIKHIGTTIAKFEPLIAALKEKFKDANPHQYTIADTPKEKP
jgi:hypothetical protein